MLAPNAKAASLMLLSIWKAFLAKPTFARSRNARTYISSRNGSNRRVTLAMVAAETGPVVASGIETGVDTISALLSRTVLHAASLASELGRGCSMIRDAG